MKNSLWKQDLLWLLVAVAIAVFWRMGPMVRAARADKDLRACKGNVKSVATALELYASDWGGRYPPELSLLVPKYLQKIPQCPAGGWNVYSVTYHCTSKPDSFSFGCARFYHLKEGQVLAVERNGQPGYPWYDTEWCLTEHP